MLVAWAAISSAIVLPYVRDHWQDEVQIIEIARGGIVDKAEDWSMVATGDPKIDSQAWAIYYLGGWMLEHAYQIGGHLGPRILTMFSFALLSLVFGLYLYRKTGDKLLSAMLAIIFWSFPPLQLSARGVRADILALLLVSLSLLVLQLPIRAKGRRLLVYSLAGSLYAASIFTWISSALLAPVVAWEMLDRQIGEKVPWRDWIASILMAGIAFCATVLLILSPFLSRWETTLEASRTIWAINTGMSSGTGHWLWKEFARCMIQPPGLYILGISFLFLRRRFLLLGLGFIVFAIVCIATRVYPSRIVYFLPYALIGAALGVTSLRQGMVRNTFMAVVALMLVFAYGRTYICRNLTDYRVRHHMDYSALCPIVEQKLGRGLSVYANTYQLYFLGRELGWKQYCYLGKHPPVEMLDKVDVCITDAEFETMEFLDLITSRGFKFDSRIEQPIPESDWLTRHIPPLGGHEPFLGPYNVYRKAVLVQTQER